MFFPVSDWFSAFVLTIAVEVPVALFALHRVESDHVRLTVLVVFANLATHPAVWFVFTQVLLVGTLPYVLVVESWAIVAEALFYAVTIRDLGWRRAVFVAVIANAASFAIGRLVGQSGSEMFP
jgi:hypothetical protein